MYENTKESTDFYDIVNAEFSSDPCGNIFGKEKCPHNALWLVIVLGCPGTCSFLLCDKCKDIVIDELQKLDSGATHALSCPQHPEHTHFHSSAEMVVYIAPKPPA